MNFLNKIFQGNNTKGMARGPLFDILGSKVAGLFGGANKENLLDRYSGWVYRCIDIISNEVASVSMKLYQGDKEVPDHEINKLLKRPNPLMSRTDLFKATQSFLSLHGDAFWHLVKEGNKIKEIWPLRPDWIKIVVNSNGDVEKYIYGQGKKLKEFLAEENNIIPFINFNPKFLNPKTPYRGVGDLEAALATVYEDEYIREWNKNFLKNGARIDGVLETDADIDLDTHKEIKRRWDQDYAGAGNSGKTPLLSGGLKYVKIGADQSSLAFIEQKKLNRDDVFLLLGLPKGLMIADDVNRANADAALYPFQRFTIKPKVIKIEEVLNERLIPLLDANAKNLAFRADDPVPEDKDYKLNLYSKLVDTVMTKNEVRKSLGLEEIKGADKLYTSFNLMELGAEEKEPVKDDKKSFVIKINDDHSSFDELTEGQQKKINSHLKAGTKFEDKYRKELKKWFKSMKDEALGLIGEEKALKKANSGLFEALKDYAKKFFGIFLPINRSIFELIGIDEYSVFDLDDEFDANNERIAKYLNKITKKASDEITDNTIETLSERIAKKIEEGATLAAIKDEVSKVFDEAYNGRVDRIARTEVFRTLNEAKQEAWRQTGVVAKKKWITMKDELTCPLCASMDGKIIELNQNFFNKNDVLEVGGESMSFDYLPVTGGALHPSCRCTVVPIMDKKAVSREKADINSAVAKEVAKQMEQINKRLDNFLKE